MSVDERTTQIVETFGDHGVEVSRDRVREQLAELHKQFRVPLDEAERSVTRQVAEDHGVSLGALQRSTRSLASIDTDGAWIDVQVKVVELWEPTHESIAQVGLVGDESGTMKFVAFETSELPPLEEGASYRLESVVTDEYQDSFSVKLNSETAIIELDGDVEVGDDMDVTGALVAIQEPSGLLKRCPEEDCTRVLQNGRCAEHGDVDGDFDLRIKAVLDDGTSVQPVIFDAAATEALTGISIEEAKQIAMDALDMSEVSERIRPRILGQYLTVNGPRIGRYVLVEEFTQRDEQPDTAAVLENARSIFHE